MILTFHVPPRGQGLCHIVGRIFKAISQMGNSSYRSNFAEAELPIFIFGLFLTINYRFHIVPAV